MGGPDLPATPPPPPPPPDPFDAQVRAAKKAQTDAELRRRGRAKTLLTGPLGDQSKVPLLVPPVGSSSGAKTALGQ